MDVQLKNRLVGAAVLFSLGIIFIPMILDGGPEKSGETLKIPPEPAPIAQAMLMPEEVQERPNAANVKPLLQSDLSTQVSNPAYHQDPLFKHQPEPRSVKEPEKIQTGFNQEVWVIQVASFARRKNAHGLTLKLQQLGYQVFEEQVSTNKGEIVRVRIGPELDYDRAKAIRKEIKAKMNLSGLVVRYR